jgi:hypothetical protein
MYALSYSLRIDPTNLGLHVAEDVLVMENPDQPEWLWGAAVSVDGRWLELSVSRDTSRVRSTFSVDDLDLLTVLQKNLLWLVDLEKEPIGPNLTWIKLVDDFEAEYSVYAISQRVRPCLPFNIHIASGMTGAYFTFKPMLTRRNIKPSLSTSKQFAGRRNRAQCISSTSLMFSFLRTKTRI